MTTIEKALKTVKTLCFAAVLVFAMVQCSEDEIVSDQAVDQDMTTEMTSISADVASISVAGVYTEIQGDVQCSTCTYVIDPNETTVDGQALGFKPGSIICIKKALKYSALDFVNMEGTEQNPIVIGYCAD